MKRLNFTGIIISMLMVASPFLKAQDTIVLDKIIAKVGGEVIFHSDVEEQMAMMREHKQNPGETERCLVLESLMAQAMLVHYAKIDSVKVTEEQINSEIDSRMNQILSMMNNDRKMFQDVYGQTVSEMREQVKDDMERKLQADKMRSEIMEKVQVTPSEVVDFFNHIPKDSLPYFNAEVELAEIVMYPEVNPEERAKAIKKINDIKDQLKAGADFEDLARKYSDDGSAKDGGNLGWTTRGSFVPEFEGAAFQLEKGQISDVVETEYGFHIIQLIERRVNSINTRHILIRPRITDADLAKITNKLDSIRHLILIDSMTFADAVHKFGNKKVQSFSNNGRMINPKTSNTFFETGDVDSEIFFSIDTLKVGGITPPIQYRTPTGDFMYKIVQLQGRTSPHLANLKQDYSRIQDAARESKRNIAFSEWLKKKLTNTYIMIDSQYSHCPNIEHWNAKWTGTSRT